MSSKSLSCASIALCVATFPVVGCGDDSSSSSDGSAGAAGSGSSLTPLNVECQLVPEGYGPAGSVPIDVEIVASGLEIPWGIVWLPDGDMLVTERLGALSRVSPDGDRVQIAEIAASSEQSIFMEGGLLGIAIHPNFEENRWFYLYYTAISDGSAVNQVERWILSEDGQSASPDRVIVANIPALLFHNGGRLRFGPDGHLYVGTGDAGIPALSQDTASLAGKILRVTDEGAIPSDNPFPGSATWIYGVRNTQGFDWLSDKRMVMTDHGPSGLPEEGGREGHDEFNVVEPGDNLGWPDVYACEEGEALLPPSMVWQEAMPPGGTAIYTGTEIPEWQGDTFIGVLGFGTEIGHLHRIRIAEDGNVELSETYFLGDDRFGRIREVVMGPDGGLYFTTSRCDGRGDCGDGDLIVRVGRR